MYEIEKYEGSNVDDLKLNKIDNGNWECVKETTIRP